MKLLIDMNLSREWVAALERAGFQAVHWESLGLGSTPDEQIMSFAKAHDLTILTNDLDFGVSLALTNAPGPSVIQLRLEDVRPAIAGARVIALLTDVQEALDQGALVTIREDHSRTRRLPLQPFIA